MTLGSEDRASFPATRWTLITRARGLDSTERKKALEEVCLLYWPPIYAYLRARGHKSHDAEDLTQGFFEELLRKEQLTKVDEGRGRLRSYLLGALKHYLLDEHRRERRVKRGGGAHLVDIDLVEAEAIGDLVDANPTGSPDRIYDRLWARRLMESAHHEIRERYQGKGQGALFDLLSPSLKYDGDPCDSADVARQLGVSESALRVAAFRLRQRYGACLRKRVADTLAPDADPDEEVNYLISIFS